MAQFYGEIQGNRGEATRMGTKDSGFRSHIRGWHVGASINCYYNEETDCDICSIYATKGSSGGSSESIAQILEKDSGIEIILNNNLPKLLNEQDYVQMKEDIASIIFDYDSITDDIPTRPHEEDCHSMAELIMGKLNYGLIGLEESNEN